jgi:hypothetical protein
LLASFPAGVSDGATLPAPYRNVQWTTLSYPGLNCSYPSGPAATATVPLMTNWLASVRVSGSTVPLAVVSMTCMLNHEYANLYVFSPGHGGAPPDLVQALGAYQGTEQLATLTTAPNRITALFAGYTPDEGLCCPTAITRHRWVWQGTRFRALPIQRITHVVMPNVVGLPIGRATLRLAALGVVAYNEHGGTGAQNQVVIAQSPRAGRVLSSPTNSLVGLTVR